MTEQEERNWKRLDELLRDPNIEGQRFIAEDEFNDALLTAESRVQELEGERDRLAELATNVASEANAEARRAEAAESHLARLEEAVKNEIAWREAKITGNAGLIADGYKNPDVLRAENRFLQAQIDNLDSALTHSTPPSSTEGETS
jgi:hypothetical protein